VSECAISKQKHILLRRIEGIEILWKSMAGDTIAEESIG